MKRFLFCCLAALVLSGCMTYHWQLGQSLDEFSRMNGNHLGRMVLVRSSTNLTVYRTPDNGTAQPYYFWFVNNKLIEVNRGERVPDITIEMQHR